MINTVQSKIIQYLYAAAHHPKLLPFALEHLSIEQVRNEYFRLKLRDNLQSHNRLLSLTVNHTNTSIPVIRLLGLMRRRSHLAAISRKLSMDTQTRREHHVLSSKKHNKLQNT